VNAFTKEPFGGNPAGVCPLQSWLPDDLLQKIAAENNLSETAFFIPKGESFHLRWFTPTVEVDLCGHATLGTVAVLFFVLGFKDDQVRFESRSGMLSARRRDDLIELDFPTWTPNPCATPKGLADALGAEPREVLETRDYVAVFESEKVVRDLTPDMDKLKKFERVGVIATAPGTDADFVSRFFAPRFGVPEDRVTGSAHCSLIPYWAKRLGKTELFARQISKRGGELFCRLTGDRVAIGGNAKIYKRGELEV
jgi:PhzF family phenazine biosynthesis protein